MCAFSYAVLCCAADPNWYGFSMYDPCAARVLAKLMNSRDLQLALGAITPSESTKEWKGCVGKSITYSVKDMAASMIPIYKELLAKSK